jgi:hypothetical protein
MSGEGIKDEGGMAYGEDMRKGGKRREDCYHHVYDEIVPQISMSQL